MNYRHYSDKNRVNKEFMHNIKIIIIFMSMFFLASCSSSYNHISKNELEYSNEFSKYLIGFYKEKANFEAKEMHDWDSAKLYAEKAIDASIGKNIIPQQINYWNLKDNDISDINASYINLMNIYDDAIKFDPYNLAKAIVSLDCWGEQLEEGWQNWDIKKCKNDFINSMHNIYESLDKSQKKEIKKEDNANNNKNATIVTEDKEKNILQIVYFDFDKSELSSVSKKKIEEFIITNKNEINKYIIIGHTDTMGKKKYNKELSIQRAITVQKILLELNIKNEAISIFGEGENNPKIITEDEVPHPANRRAEISLLN